MQDGEEMEWHLLIEIPRGQIPKTDEILLRIENDQVNAELREVQ